LIQAYKASAAEAVSQAIIVERFVEEIYRLEFAYDRLGAVLAAVERMGLPLIEQTFGDGASLTIALRQSVAPTLLSELRARIAGVSLDEARAIDELPGIAIHHRGLR
jgi:putative IMPACT (imprinted ancient) family translation regulator